MTQFKTPKDVWKRDLARFKQDIKKFDTRAYVKSFSRNLYSSIGLTSYIASLALSTFLLPNYNDPNFIGAENLAYITLFMGLGGLGTTCLGKTTYDTYTKTRRILAKNKKIPQKIVGTCLDMYCNTVGLNMARREFGLEPLLHEFII